MDKLRAMRTFVRIVETGSLTGAARTLGMSLTAVVRSLASLERHLGVRLLNRTTRRVAVTEEGREYLDSCRRVLAEVEAADAALSDRRAMPSGRLAITAPVMFGRLHVAPIVTTFLAQYPAVEVELLLLDRIVDLIDEGMDIAVRIGRLPASSQVAIEVGSMGQIVCASPRYLRAHGTPKTPRALSGHRCVRFSGAYSATEWEFQEHGRTSSVHVSGNLVTNQTEAALDACVGGLGCGRFLAYQVKDHLAAGRLRRILVAYEPPPVPVSLVLPHSRLMSARVRAFVDWAAGRLRKRLGSRA